VLILQGEQSIGKSTWFEKLVPSKIKKYFLSGATLDPANKDSVKTVISNWIVELGELESTFGKDMARLKAIITNSKDVIRVPYAPLDSNFSRSTVFAGSVNSDQFLIDHTGNTRFWSLPVVSLNTNHNIDTQQFWAEVAVLYKNGEKWWLTSEEEKLLELNNKEFLSISPFEELLQEKYNFSKPATQPITATELLINLGYLNPGKKQRNEMGQVLRKLGVKINRLSKYLMPPQYEVEEKKLIDSENHYEELKNKQRAQILNTTIHKSFSPYEASIIINECTFDHLVYENKFVLNLSSKFNLPQEQRTQLLQVIKSVYGEGITIISSNLN
jgi:predicted P-loop ATPase